MTGGTAYYKRSIAVSFFVAPKADASTARGHVYALCRDTSIAPLAPALGDLTVRKAGRKSPVDVAGNHLHQGHRIRKGTQLRRWTVSMRGPSTATTTLSCPRGMVHRGLAQQEGAKVSATVLKTSGYGHRTIKVRFSARPGASGEAAGSIYALCG